ncbi:hypothetical protein PanWU01x14_296150 [Parasponia andersonii]|uniref:Uncharacterized protein n=1 Tax=Parasponia andersonii TaxID=3476 RepID=A0A2P5AVK6_PARAD|nr:hypothetical protein PanWU01x14_296150 [Parasponia andersonii]
MAKFVITATSANKPIFEMREIAPNTVTLALGVDELPTDYFSPLMEADDIFVADDIEVMESFDADSLALYYLRNDLQLTEDGKDDGVQNYVEVLSDPTLMEKIETWDGQASFSAASLVNLDVVVAATSIKLWGLNFMVPTRKTLLRRIGLVRRTHLEQVTSLAHIVFCISSLSLCQR